MPKWNTVSISGYHFREKGASAVQEVAFTLANGMAYVQAAIDAGPRGRRVRARAWPSSSTATTTSSRRWRSSAPPGGCGRSAMRERFGATNPKAMMLRFHTQTGGVTLTAQQPVNNIVRVALQALRGGLRRHAVAAHQRLRRGARAALRARGEDRAAHPADHRPRVGRGRHRRPVRRLLLRRGADRRDRAARADADRPRRRAGRLGRRRSRSSRARSRSRPSATTSATGPGRTSSSASTGTCEDDGGGRGDPPRRPGGRARAGRAPAGVQGRPRPGSSPSGGSRSCARPAAATATCCRRSAQALKDRARSARSAARCATSSGEYQPDDRRRPGVRERRRPPPSRSP